MIAALYLLFNFAGSYKFHGLSVYEEVVESLSYPCLASSFSAPSSHVPPSVLATCWMKMPECVYSFSLSQKKTETSPLSKSIGRLYSLLHSSTDMAVNLLMSDINVSANYECLFRALLF